ncbi:SPOR domain-containing protein [Anditalea andensis]|uniref:SPOR domain-containing protein n=1 Tax=Anditalea andensis TaxID=1048983 RepID=A0A074KYH3_9BACT|nr:SPOR domain-containing protein [Anditalea andensis]KEO74009.1 hypothetical protein EL17_07610 [Anditalea andensis]
MAYKDNQDKHSKTDEDKDYGLPKVEIVPLSSRSPQSVSENDNKPDLVKPKTIIADEESVSSNEPIIHETVKSKPAFKAQPSLEAREKQSNYRVWIILSLVLLLIFAGIFWYWNNIAEQDTRQPEPITTPIEPEKVLEPEIVEDDAETVEEVPETFTLTTIKSRAAAPRYFVVVGSFIDEDMALDYSNKLNRQQKNTYLVYPYGEIAYYRLAIGEYESLVQAVEVLEAHQENYKENLWVLKY